jgi:hypothetical protein
MATTAVAVIKPRQVVLPSNILYSTGNKRPVKPSRVELMKREAASG